MLFLDQSWLWMWNGKNNFVAAVGTNIIWVSFKFDNIWHSHQSKLFSENFLVNANNWHWINQLSWQGGFCSIHTTHFCVWKESIWNTLLRPSLSLFNVMLFQFCKEHLKSQNSKQQESWECPCINEATDFLHCLRHFWQCRSIFCGLFQRQAVETILQVLLDWLNLTDETNVEMHNVCSAAISLHGHTSKQAKLPQNNRSECQLDFSKPLQSKTVLNVDFWHKIVFRQWILKSLLNVVAWIHFGNWTCRKVMSNFQNILANWEIVLCSKWGTVANKSNLLQKNFGGMIKLSNAKLLESTLHRFTSWNQKLKILLCSKISTKASLHFVGQTFWLCHKSHMTSSGTKPINCESKSSFQCKIFWEFVLDHLHNECLFALHNNLKTKGIVSSTEKASLTWSTWQLGEFCWQQNMLSQSISKDGKSWQGHSLGQHSVHFCLKNPSDEDWLTTFGRGHQFFIVRPNKHRSWQSGSNKPWNCSRFNPMAFENKKGQRKASLFLLKKAHKHSTHWEDAPPLGQLPKLSEWVVGNDRSLVGHSSATISHDKKVKTDCWQRQPTKNVTFSVPIWAQANHWQRQATSDWQLPMSGQ